jgi:hypothetical protein
MTVFAGEHRLLYRRLAQGQARTALRLDDYYRFHHLPLINPDHPEVIATRPDSDAVMGRYAAPRFSLVISIDDTALHASAAYRQLLARLRRAPFAAKIAWDNYEQRRNRLHATLRSNLQRDYAPGEICAIAARLRRLPAFRARLIGPWYGDRNHGRLYLPLVPELQRGFDACRRVQRAAGGPEVALYTVGLTNFTDHLDEGETAALRRLINEYRSRVLLDFAVTQIDLHATHDDLALDSRIVKRIALRR